jgi:hypothetical protein
VRRDDDLADVGLGQELTEEGVGVRQTAVLDDVLVGDEAVAPVEAKAVLAGACVFVEGGMVVAGL